MSKQLDRLERTWLQRFGQGRGTASVSLCKQLPYVHMRCAVRICAVAEVRVCLAVRMVYIVTDFLLASVPSGTPVPGRTRNVDFQGG
jgi:hypothetical protein